MPPLSLAGSRLTKSAWHDTGQTESSSGNGPDYCSVVKRFGPGQIMPWRRTRLVPKFGPELDILQRSRDDFVTLCAEQSKCTLDHNFFYYLVHKIMGLHTLWELLFFLWLFFIFGITFKIHISALNNIKIPWPIAIIIFYHRTLVH